MNINTDEIQKNINRLIDAGISPILKKLLWVTDSENTQWLIDNEELYNNSLWQYNKLTGKVYISEEFLEENLREMQKELKSFQTYGKPVITDDTELSLEIKKQEKFKQFIEQKLQNFKS